MAISLRAKHKTGSQHKTSKDNRKVKIARHKNWNEVTVDDPNIQHMLVGRPRKLKDANELLSQFNSYLASCIEKTRKAKLVPVKTEELDQNKINILDDEEKGGKVKWKGGQTTITNNVISQFEIIEGVERHTTPTIGGFLIFLGGLSYDTWDKYRDRAEFTETIKTIDNILETIRVDEASKGHINPSIAALVLNVRYNRIPKKEIDSNVKGSIFKETDFIDD